MAIKIGEKIKNLRLASDLTQAELADRAGLTKGFISQLERDLTSISLDSLEDILIAMDTSLSEFFSEAPEDKPVYTEQDRRSIEYEGLQSFELLVPGATNRRMEAALVVMKPGEYTEEIEPFRGEVFGMVFQGRIALKIGRQTYKAKNGDSFYFSADQHHQISNTGAREAKFLWITSPPYF
jgi:transcriptional regulator with XRE-family HTH domain